jgi:hypothetical protein
MAIRQNKAEPEGPPSANMEEEIAYLAKRHRVSPAIVREIIRATGATQRAQIEREIAKGKARR